MLSRLRSYGVETIELGAQSMSDRVLALSGRGHTAQDVADAAEPSRRAGFRLILQMMTGLPGADDESDVETARRHCGARAGRRARVPDGHSAGHRALRPVAGRAV